MVAIRSQDAERFLEERAAHIFLYLFFGPDAGLVSERARALALRSVEDPKDPFALLRLGGDDLAADPLRLADEANTIGLFGGRRAIWIEAQGRAFAQAVEPLFAAPPQDSTIIIEAGALKADAALRRLCEREKRAAAIACAPDSPADVERLIEREAKAAGLAVSAEAKQLLASLLGQDRLATRAEIAKLTLYTHGTGEIGYEDVAAIVADASELALDDAVDSAFSGDFAALDAGARRLAAQGSDAGALLGAALRHGLGLRRARLGGEGRPAEGAARAAWAFRRSRGFGAHLRLWTAERLGRAVELLAEAVGRARREPRLAGAIALRALWSVASAARAGARKG